MRSRLRSLLVEYGLTALVLHYLLFAAVLVGARVALGLGWTPPGAVATLGAWAVAYVVAKATQPVRLALLVLLTPLVARLWERVTGRRPGGLAFLAPPPRDSSPPTTDAPAPSPATGADTPTPTSEDPR